MAYGDYKNVATLQGTIVPDMTPPPGEAANVAWIKNGENAEQTKTNRPHQALAVNMDNLKIPLDAAIAVTQTAALAAFSGNSITIDPTGGAAGDINFTGTLFLGTGYANTQENRDTLFQLLDENYNEVMVEGSEVKISSVGGGAVGGGFYSAGVVTLGLNETLVSANYRLRYAIGATLASLPDDALITADIRGIHEGAGESAKPTDIVCAPAGGYGNYVGSSALEDALTDIGVGGNASIYLKDGTYALPAGATSIPIGVSIIGESANAPGSGGVIIQMVATSTIDCKNYSHIERVRIEVSGPTGAEYVGCTGNHVTIENVLFTNTSLLVSGDWFKCDNILINPHQNSLLVQGANYSEFKNIEITPATTPPTAIIAISTATLSGTTFDNIQISDSGTTAKGILLSIAIYSCEFRNIEMTLGTGIAIDLGAVTINECRFLRGYISADQTAITTDATARARGIEFKDCFFDNTNSAWYKTPFVRLKSLRGDSGTAAFYNGISLDHCYFSDRYCMGDTDTGTPAAPNLDGSPFPVMELEGVMGRSVSFLRSNMLYNIESSQWVKMTDCSIDSFALVSGPVGNMTPLSSLAASTSGLVEVLGQSKISELKVLTDYEEEVSRAIVYVQNSNDHLAAGAEDKCLPAEIDGLQISMSSSTAWIDIAAPSSLGLHMGGNSIVRNFVWNSGNSFRVRDDVGLGGIEASGQIVYINGDYNVLDNPMIELDGANGSVWHAISVGTAADYSNTIRGGAVKLIYAACTDPAAVYYPYSAVLVAGTSTVIDGLNVFTNAPQTIVAQPINVAGYHTRVVNCHIDVDGDPVIQPNLILFNGIVDQDCICMGNVLRSRLNTPPTISGAAVGVASNVTVLNANPVVP